MIKSNGEETEVVDLTGDDDAKKDEVEPESAKTKYPKEKELAEEAGWNQGPEGMVQPVPFAPIGTSHGQGSCRTWKPRSRSRTPLVAELLYECTGRPRKSPRLRPNSEGGNSGLAQVNVERPAGGPDCEVDSGEALSNNTETGQSAGGSPPSGEFEAPFRRLSKDGQGDGRGRAPDPGDVPDGVCDAVYVRGVQCSGCG